MKRKRKLLQPNHSKILSKDLKWLLPYLESIQDIIPLDKVKKIEYYQTRHSHMKEHHKAIAHRLGNNKDFHIFIRTKLPKAKRIPLRYYEQEDYMFFLAHELAHVVHFEHDKAHFKLLTDVFARFGQVLGEIDFEEMRNK